ncbi:MAG: acyl CoA:acetate/3-ketoacid CoA transferase [Peptococcia bacterium]
MMAVKFLTAREAVDLIKDDDCVAFGGFVANAHPETLSKALEARFLDTGSPRNITIVTSTCQGDGEDGGLNHLAHEGLVKRVIAGHWNLAPKLGALALANKIEAYNFPQGVIARLFRDIAAHNVGTITHVGLNTFVDPRVEGGKLNEVTREDLVELINIAGQERLFYKTFPINAVLLRGTYADEKGNISLEQEAVTLDSLQMAQAARNSGGVVIVQVKQVVKAGSLDPKLIRIPGILVDAVVVGEAEDSWQTGAEEYNPAYTGAIRVPVASLPPLALDERKIIARRAALELQPDTVVNLGIGMPEAVAMVANEEGIGDYMTLTLESGPVGGIPAGGLSFGAATNPEAILGQGEQFDFYDGGGVDLAYLGAAEVDADGNVNVSKLGAKIPGCGGFINITQNAKKVFYCGSFTAGGLKISCENGKLVILQEGKNKKFVERVNQITFSGQYARKVNQPVMYITERCVFELQEDGVHLIEIAPGVDLEKDILANMGFKPIIDGEPKLMDARIFREKLMGLGD